MLLFLLALIISGLGVAAYAHYDPGAHDINFPNFHFAAVPDWVPLAIAAGRHCAPRGSRVIDQIRERVEIAG